MMEFLASNTRRVQAINFTATEYHIVATITVTDQVEQPGTRHHKVFN